MNGGKNGSDSLRELYYMIRKRMWLVIVLFLLATITSGLISQYVLTPEYSTYSTLMLGKSADYDGSEGISYQDIQTNQKFNF